MLSSRYRFDFARISTLASLSAFLILASCIDSVTAIAPDIEPLLGRNVPSWNSGPVASMVAFGSQGYSAVASVTYANGVSGVVSQIQPVGDWVLETNAKKSTRYIAVNVSNVVLSYNTVPLPFEGSQNVQGRFISKLSMTGVTYPSMIAGQTTNAPLVFLFAYAGKTYRINMNPAKDDPSRPELESTDYADASCLSVASDGKCNRWTLKPKSAQGGIALLMRVNSDGSTIPIALVRMSFDIGFSR